jgi:diguanylate cyclase (GGDEF)-like protein
MKATINALRHAAFPPVPEAIRDDFTLLRAARLQSQIPLLYLTLLFTIPTAIYGSSEGASPIIRFGIPVFMATMCLLRFFAWMKKRGMTLDVDRAAKMIKAATWVSCSLGVLCSIWCVMSWFSAPSAMRIYYPMIMAMGSLATAYCLSTIRFATILNLAIGLLPITVLLLFTGNRMDVAAGTSLAVASAFLLRMIWQQHVQLVDLLMLQRKMRDLANTDPLTGLLNRRALDARLQQEIAGAGAEASFSVALLDLDGFKPVNDCHGHAAGDILLCEVANRLCQAGGDHVVVARLGGDEFAILVPQGSPIASSAIANHMLSALVPPHRIGGHDIRIGASIGVACWPADGRTADTLFDTADRALYAAKAESKHERRAVKPGRVASASQR